MSALKRVFLLFLFLFCIGATVSAQNVNDALSYGNQAVMFGDQRELTNPVTGIMPGTASASGFGAFLDNPASIALFDESFGELGLTFKRVNEDALFRGNSVSEEDGQTSLSNAGFIYSFPTERGSLVIGAGYNQHSAQNRAIGFNARNEDNTITDQFKIPGNTYADVAFNTYAIDYGDNVEDWDESIFRIGFDQFGDYLGIRQQGEITQRGFSGEYSAFLATEFQENLMIGASIGLLAGRFSYDRIFQEVDEFNDYNAMVIDTDDDDEPDTDVDNILLSDEIDSRYSGFRARIGGLYRISSNLNIGASYTFPTRISVDENFDATIRTTFDNGVEFDDSIDGQFSYAIDYPSRTSLGIALEDLQGLTISLSTEYVNYSNTEIDFEDDELFEDQLAENQFISEKFDAVWNYRGGASIAFNPVVSLRGGYGYLPSRYTDGIDDKHLYSAGVGFQLTPEAVFEIGGQYMRWEEESAVYTYGDLDYSALPDSAPPVTIRSEDAQRTVDLFQIMATVKIALN